MRYFTDEPMFGNDFMCARVSEAGTETKKLSDGLGWEPFQMSLDALLEMVDAGFLVEVERDPFTESLCNDN